MADVTLLGHDDDRGASRRGTPVHHGSRFISLNAVTRSGIINKV